MSSKELIHNAYVTFVTFSKVSFAEGVFEMNLQDLVYFKYLAECLSFTETADHFFVSQPSISTALKRLETALDTVLIDRRKTLKKIKVTPAGQILYENATEVIKILANTKQQIHSLYDETVYLGFLPTIGGSLMPQILPKLKQPTHSIRFVEDESSDAMLQMVKKAEVPIAIIGHDTPDILGGNIHHIPVLTQEMSLWVAPSHPLAGRSQVENDDFKDEVFISLSEGYTHHRIFEKWTQGKHIYEPNVVFANEIKTVLSIAASTHMIAFMSDIIVDDMHDLVKVKIKNPPKFYVSLIVNRETENTLFQQRFNDEVVAIVEDVFVED